jgi:AGCS family alanine or glycine:cation symporter
MWAVAFLGAGSAFVESALGQIYKTKKMVNIVEVQLSILKKGFPIKKLEKYMLSFLPLLLFLLLVFVTWCTIKQHCFGSKNTFAIDHVWTGVLLVILLGLIIFGGIKSIANVAQFVVPFMATAYILVAIVILVMNFSSIPSIFSLIISSAFGANATFGGIVGAMITIGVKRGVYSNEAGQGTDHILLLQQR